jgi:glutathione-specific gamma-glutamylcyclotransferase
MWQPGFEYEAAVPARLNGAHRSLCIYSVRYRGTKTAPGLVLGLDLSGCCDGMAFLVSENAWPQTVAYLHRREMVTKVYSPAMRPVTLLDGGCHTVRALAFTVNRRHKQYAGQLPLHVQAAIVRRARGAAGPNADYVVNTVAHLRTLDIRDRHLERLTQLLGGRIPGEPCS